MTAVVKLIGVAKRFGRGPGGVQALSAVTLTVDAGERVAVVGANGCGKSTLLRLIHGLTQPSAGQVVANAALRQAMLFQRPQLLRLSVQTNLAIGPWLAGMPWAEARAQALVALQRVSLLELAGRSARHLSGGQQQRVALARAWALQPQVLLLDEPTASLDPQAKRDVEALIHEFAQQSPNMTLVFSSHNLGQVKRLASRVIYLEGGRVLADLPVQEFFNGTVLPTLYPAAHQFVKGETA
ncbi:MAG: ATP-binding cassette domain-containing protein [Candidatus Saccharibacteria bacterium]|nr:ATP-binding cassette domain-containing protein [Rhodoferax sp.]